MRSAPITGGGAAPSRSKLEAIAPVGLLVPVGAAGAAFRFIREKLSNEQKLRE
jgi:hypothetical protein